MKLFLFLCLGLYSLEAWASERLPRKKLHENMSPEELRRVFHVNHPSQVPEYEVVHVRSIHKRSTADPGIRNINLSAFGRRLNLRLKKNKEFEKKLRSLKVFSVKTAGDKLKFTEEKPPKEDYVGTTYHDDREMAAVLVRHADDGTLELEGTIGSELVIRPTGGLVDDEMFLDEDEPVNNASGQEVRRGTHVVYRRPAQDNATSSDFLPLDSTMAAYLPSPKVSRHRRKKRRAPDTVWPEVLVVLDYETFRLHNRDSRDLKRYFVSFWNGVDLRYKTLSYPRVRVSLAGMIVAKDKDATPYLEQNRLHAPNADAVDAAAALTDMGKYLYREDRLPTYDLAVLVTKLDMCRRQFDGGRCGRGTAGFAYVGGACVVNKRLEKVNSVAIIEDSGGYSGIIVAAHEVGHLLGCVHDGSPAPSYLGGPGATRCPWEDGFIMSDLRHTERGFRWSTCSVEQFKHFLNGETAGCLFNYPQDNQLLSRNLPGSTMTLDEQCQKDRGTQACFKDARVCAQLFCYDTASGYCVSYRPAAEGSNCGDGQVCRNGKCTVDVENIIPDYSQVTFTAERRADSPLPPTNSTRAPAWSTARIRKPALLASTTPPAQRLAPKPAVSAGCEDLVDHLAGKLTCTEFLQRYGYRYCSHQYLKQRCCRSHALVCSAKS